MFAANGIANQVVSGAWVPGDYPPGTNYLLITKKTYPASTTSLTLDFNPTLGGGTVQFTGYAPYNNSTAYGPQTLFDNVRQPTYAWTNKDNEPNKFAKFVFPTRVYVTKIFLVPVAAGDGLLHFPSSVAIYSDGVLAGTFTQKSTISPAVGLVMNYTGTGYDISLAINCSTLELRFGTGSAYIDEMEIRGGLTP